MARPKKVIDYDAIRELASENNRVTDICRAIGISRQLFYSTPAAQEAFENGRADMRINLNHWQWMSAKNNPQMQIYLGKQVLGQDDGAANGEEGESRVIMRKNGDIEVQ